MIKDPTIHITKSNLKRILLDLGVENAINRKSLTDLIMQASIPYQIRDRYLTVLEQKSKTRKKVQKVQKVAEVSDEDVYLLNRLLVSIRQGNNSFSTAKPVKAVDTTQFTLLKEITLLAIDFCEEFGIENRRDGFKEYITMGVTIMRRYALNKFKTYHQRIKEKFNDWVLIVNDPNKQDTSLFHEYLVEAMKYYSGMDFFIAKDDFSKYVHCYYGRLEADEAGADYEDWIIAQFEGLEFTGGVPELYQFYGEGSLARYESFRIKEAKNKQGEEKSLTEIYTKNEDN